MGSFEIPKTVLHISSLNGATGKAYDHSMYDRVSIRGPQDGLHKFKTLQKNDFPRSLIIKVISKDYGNIFLVSTSK